MKELESLEEFDSWIKHNIETPVAFQEIDLTDKDHDQFLKSHSFKDFLFLGCRLTDEAAGHIVNTGGIVIPPNIKSLFKTHKAQLYSADELFAGFDVHVQEGYQHTIDYKIYEEYVAGGKDYPSTIQISFARRLHDHSITDALLEVIEGRKVVAIMGGHGMERSDPFYLKTALIARKLSQDGFLMISGGGPGAMEATHFGAYFSAYSEKEMIDALSEMMVRPLNAPKNKEYNDPDWLHRAWKIKEKYPFKDIKSAQSLGIPTWHYGHEPPAVFASHIAKYFANSVREDGLLAIAKHGVIFAPGSAGTTQEIFQDAAQNHYAPYNTHTQSSYVSPMILFGSHHWVDVRPTWPLLKKVSEGLPYGELVTLTDDENEIIERIKSYDPEDYKYPQ